MKYFCVIILVLMVLPLRSQNIVTDRPDMTESALSVPLGSFQIESGVLIQKENFKGVSYERFVFPGTLFRYGIIENFELRVFSEYINSEIKNNYDKKEFSGMSDIQLGGKFELTEGAVNTAILAHAYIPSGNKHFTTDEYGFMGRVALSHAMNDDLSFCYNIGYSNYTGNDGNLIYTVATGFNITDELCAFLEYYGNYVNMEEDENNIDAGLTYLIDYNLQVDISLGSSLDHTMNFYSAGISWRIDKE